MNDHERSQPLLDRDDSPEGSSEILITAHGKNMLRDLRNKEGALVD